MQFPSGPLLFTVSFLPEELGRPRTGYLAYAGYWDEGSEADEHDSGPTHLQALEYAIAANPRRFMLDATDLRDEASLTWVRRTKKYLEDQGYPTHLLEPEHAQTPPSRPLGGPQSGSPDRMTRVEHGADRLKRVVVSLALLASACAFAGAYVWHSVKTTAREIGLEAPFIDLQGTAKHLLTKAIIEQAPGAVAVEGSTRNQGHDSITLFVKLDRSLAADNARVAVELWNLVRSRVPEDTTILVGIASSSD